MSDAVCPICEGQLEVIDVAPCFDCGHKARELEELSRNRHIYHVFRAFDLTNIVLCDFCDADFGSYKPDYFGYPHTGQVIGTDGLELVGELPKPWESKREEYCPKCQHRLAFLEFRKMVLKHNEPT